MTPTEILDACDHSEGHVGLDEYSCDCLMCSGNAVCLPCALRAIEAAREEEREACAKAVEAIGPDYGSAVQRRARPITP